LKGTIADYQFLECTVNIFESVICLTNRLIDVNNIQ